MTKSLLCIIFNHFQYHHFRRNPVIWPGIRHELAHRIHPAQHCPRMLVQKRKTASGVPCIRVFGANAEQHLFGANAEQHLFGANAEQHRCRSPGSPINRASDCLIKTILACIGQARTRPHICETTNTKAKKFLPKADETSITGGRGIEQNLSLHTDCTGMHMPAMKGIEKKACCWSYPGMGQLHINPAVAHGGPAEHAGQYGDPGKPRAGCEPGAG
jgi:hypothetical protein